MSAMDVRHASLSDREYSRVAIAIMGEAGLSYGEIGSVLDVSRSTIGRWSNRQEHELTFMDLPRPGIERIYTEADRKRLVAFYCQTSMLPNGHGRWTVRTAAKYLQNNIKEIGTRPTKSTIQRILACEGLKPHRSKYFLHVTDPQFFPKMEHLLELRRNPPENLFYFDECPGIQVRQRLSPRILNGMSESQFRVWLEEFEYIRHGTLDVFAFLEDSTGKIYAECRPDHTKATLDCVFRNHVTQVRKHTTGRLDYVMDNLASHYSYELCCLVAELCVLAPPIHLEKAKADARRKWLSSEDKQIVIHYTPYHGSWLNLVEIWFGILSRGCLKESYSSPDEILEAILCLVEQWNLHYAHPFNFNYDGEGLHEIVVQRFVDMLKSVENFNNRFLNKQLKLMLNLHADYHHQIKPQTWKQLTALFQEKSPELIEQIMADEKEKRRAQTLQNFHRLTHLLQKAEQKDKDKAA